MTPNLSTTVYRPFYRRVCRRRFCYDGSSRRLFCHLLWSTIRGSGFSRYGMVSILFLARRTIPRGRVLICRVRLGIRRVRLAKSGQEPPSETHHEKKDGG